MDSKQSSLYDAFDDQYDSPFMKQETQRAVSLPPGFLKDTHQQMAEAKKAHREFSTVRQQLHQHRHQHDVETDALFFVSGRTPLHLRLEEYDLFDSQEWYPAVKPRWKADPSFRKREGKPWLQLDTNSTNDNLFAGAESHSLKTVALEGNHIPLPLNTTELHIDRVDRPDLFSWSRDSILQLQRKTIPKQLVIHTRSRVVDPEVIPTLESQSFLKRSMNLAHTVNPTDFATLQVEKLAAKWTNGLERGWAQIDGVISKLRSEYVHDRKHRISEESVNPTAQFVLSDRRGADFLFASAAAVMLRSLDYPTRLVSGFYASPENYDRTTGHTAVFSEDVHFWCEVYVGANTWLPLEPTPGYEILAPRLTFIQWLDLQVQRIVEWASQRWPMLTAAIVLLLVGWKIGVWQSLRDRLFDAAWTLQWQWSMRGNSDPRRQLQATRRLVLRRCRLTRWTRLSGESDHRLMRRVFESVDTPQLGSEMISGWLRLLDWDRFSPPGMAISDADPAVSRMLARQGFSSSEIRSGTANTKSVAEYCCRHLAGCLTVSSLRSAGNADPDSLQISTHQSSVTNLPTVGDRLIDHPRDHSRSVVGNALSAG